MLMYATYGIKEVNEDVMSKGTTISNGVSEDNEVILCRKKPFPIDWGDSSLFIVIAFEKSLNEIYIDKDTGLHEEISDILPGWAITWDEITDKSFLDGHILFDAYVKEIRSEEIKGISVGYCDEEGECHMYEGGMYCMICYKVTRHIYWKVLARYFRQCVKCDSIISGMSD